VSDRGCIEQGCGREPFSLGLCRDHFEAERPRAWPRCAATDYIGVHFELRRYLGPARSYPCADCQKQAEDWSYQGSAPDERLGSSGPFSRDPSFYVPRCRSCHKRHDVAARTHCRKGHPLDEDNTDTTTATSAASTR
jgi:hypothetical protein